MSLSGEERLDKEIRRRTNVVGIFPDRAAIIRLVGSVLIGETEEWMEQRRSMSAEALAKVTRVTVAETEDPATEQAQRSLPEPMGASARGRIRGGQYTTRLDATWRVQEQVGGKDRRRQVRTHFVPEEGEGSVPVDRVPDRWLRHTDGFVTPMTSTSDHSGRPR